MDAHTCWQVGLSKIPLPEQELLRFADYAEAFIPWRTQGEATISAALQHIPHYAHYFVLRHGEHCAMFHAAHRHDWVLNGHPLLLQLAASPCNCRSKTQLLTSAAFSAAQLYHVDRAGLGGQCIVPNTVNLGLTIHTGWTCQLHTEQMEYAPLRLTMPSLLTKQLLKFRTRLIAGTKGNLSIHAKILYFNAFSLSLFYYMQTHRYFSKPLLQPLCKALSEFLLRRHWSPQFKLVGLCRWLRLGPLLDPALMHAVSLFGCYLRQGHCSLPSVLEGADESYTKQIYSCWKYSQHQLPPDEIRQLVDILNQSRDSSQAARRFQECFKQFAIAKEVDSAISHLSNRVSQNGWPFGPSFEFLQWLSRTPISQVGAVPRFAVLRWALGEDPDLWLPLRGRVSRNSSCAWCAQRARTYPFGPQKGALCVSCIGPDPGAFADLPPEALSFLQHHALPKIAGPAPPLPIKTKAQNTSGPFKDVAVAPCVLCQGGSNMIDHWLSYCPVVQIAWVALHKSHPPAINWRQTPIKHTGIALTYLLFHLRRIVTEYGGLRPNITCVKVKSISAHALDLWQRTYQSLPATQLAWFRAPPVQADLHCTSTAAISVRRFPQTQLESALLPDRGLCTTKAFQKDETIATFATADARLRLLLYAVCQVAISLSYSHFTSIYLPLWGHSSQALCYDGHPRQCSAAHWRSSPMEGMSRSVRWLCP